MEQTLATGWETITHTAAQLTAAAAANTSSVCHTSGINRSNSDELFTTDAAAINPTHEPVDSESNNITDNANENNDENQNEKESYSEFVA